MKAGIANALPTANTLTINAGIFDLNGFSQSVGSLGGTASGTLTNSGAAATFTDTTSGSDTFAGTISGTNLALTLNGSGTLALSGSNSYAGITSVTAGTLSYNTIAAVSGGNSALGAPTSAANGTINIGATGILKYTGAGSSSDRVINLTASGATIDASGAGTLTLSGGVTGNTFNLVLAGTGAGIESGAIATTSGSLTKNGSGTWTLSSGSNSYTGATTVSLGTLKAGIANALPTSTALSVTGTFDLAGFAQQVASVTGSGIVTDSAAAANFTINNSGADTFAGTLTGSLNLVKSAAGTLTLSSASSYTGTTTISSGTIAIGVANALPTGTALSDAGTLDLAGFAQQVASVTGSGVVTDSAAAANFTINNSSADTFAGTLTGSLNLVKSNSGTLTLNSANTYTGATTISAGQITNGIANALPTGTALANAGTLDIAGFAQQVASITGSGIVTDSGAAANFTINNSGADTFAGTMTGSLNLVKSAAGTLTLSGASSLYRHDHDLCRHDCKWHCQCLTD